MCLPTSCRNLDDAERRCLALKALLQKLAPDLNVERALKESKHVTREDEDYYEQHNNSSLVDASPEPSDGFEWSEASLASPAGDPDPSRKGGPDGMATLPTKQYEAGYLGKTPS